MVSSQFLSDLSRSDATPSELSLLFYLLARIRLGSNVVPHFAGVEAAEATGLHPSSVSTAVTRLTKRQVVRRTRSHGHSTIVINPHLASRADQKTREELCRSSRMPVKAITRLNDAGDRR